MVQSMVAKLQYQLTSPDLEVLLALVRGGTLDAASGRLGVDSSTVFRAIQRIEKGLGQRLFERKRSGYLPYELVQTLVEHAERIETELESARSATQQISGDVSGIVRITTTNSILHGLIVPCLKQLSASHPMLDFELHTGSVSANLSRHDADIAVRATKHPPQHLAGKHVGTIRLAMYTGTNCAVKSVSDAMKQTAPWIEPDDASPNHPSIRWRMRHLPKVVPKYRVNDFLAVMSMIELGFGVGILPVFLAEGHKGLVRITDALDECQNELWVLTHPESRHLRRIATVFSHLSKNLNLDRYV